MFRFFQTLESRVENLEEEINEIADGIEARRQRLAEEADALHTLRQRFNRLVG